MNSTQIHHNTNLLRGERMRWVKVYFNKDQYDEWRSGTGSAIGYLEEGVNEFKDMEKRGINCDLKNDPLDHMTKVSPNRIREIPWTPFGVYVD
jgi:hypothetical protein